MKATDKNILEMSVQAQEKLPVPDELRIEPSGFKDYIWISQDGKVTPIEAFEDMHLFYTYRMLINTIMYAKNKAKHVILSDQMRAVVEQCNYHLRYIAYEYYFRHYIEEKELDKKYRIIKHVAVRMEDVES